LSLGRVEDASDQGVEWRRRQGNRLLEKSSEELAPVARPPAVEPKGELVEVEVEMPHRLASLVGAQQPPFQEPGDQVDARQKLMGLLPAAGDVADRVGVALASEPDVAAPRVRVDRGSWSHDTFDEALEAGLGGIADGCQADAADPRPPGLSSDPDQAFRIRLAADTAFRLASDEGLIHLHGPAQPITTGRNHCPTKLVQPRPGGLVTPEAQLLLKGDSVHAGAGAGHQPGRPKPDPERRLGVVEDSARRQRRLVAAGGALHQSSLAHRPALASAARRTGEAIRPAQAPEVATALRFGREPSLEVLEARRVGDLRHPASLPEGCGDPILRNS